MTAATTQPAAAPATIDPVTARRRIDRTIADLIDGITTEQRGLPTPCEEWNVDQLIAHMVGGGHMIAAGLLGDQPTADADPLANGLAAAWAATTAHLAEASTPEILDAMHHMPFGEVPGAMALSVITADHIVHAWDLGEALGVDVEIGDDLVALTMSVFGPLAPADDRSGGQFKDVVEVPDSASALDRMIGFSGRRP